MKNSSVLLLLSLFLHLCPNLFGQEIKIGWRRMTDQEFQRLKQKIGTYQKGKNYNKVIYGHGTGLRPLTAVQWETMKDKPIVADKLISTFAGAPPAYHDNSATIYFPPIGNQEEEGSCVSWACGYYMKTFQEAKEHHWDLSACLWEGGYDGEPGEAYQDKIFSPDFIYHQVNGGEDNGSNYSDNMNLLERIGCCTWDQMPYDPSDTTSWPKESAWRQAPLYRSKTGYGYMRIDTDEALNDLKRLLADSNLAIISVNANYYGDNMPEDLWTLDNYDANETNHANTIVGYDDEYGPFSEKGNPEVFGAFKVANSWGVGDIWENIADGFYYISFECMKKYIEYIYFYEDRIDYEPQMIAVFQNIHDKRGECETAVGIGKTSSPDTTKRFDDYVWAGGDHPYPANNMAMDITEFKPFMSGANDTFFLQIYDGGSLSAGMINFFSIEVYNNYGSGLPIAAYISKETPVKTINFSTKYARLSTEDIIPVELSSFMAEKSHKSILLTWHTKTESNNYGFQIYRSLEPHHNYSRINAEIIRGAGTSVREHTYHYIDTSVQPGNIYYYKLTDVDFTGKMTLHGPISIALPSIPAEYILEQNYPNPFNPETAIRFSLKEKGMVSLKIYNLQGKLIRIMVDQNLEAGLHSVVWNATDERGIKVANGAYLYTLKINGFEETKMMIFVK